MRDLGTELCPEYSRLPVRVNRVAISSGHRSYGPQADTPASIRWFGSENLLRRLAFPLRARHPLAREHGAGREQALLTGARAFVVVDEFEIAFAQFEDRHVGRRANIER